MRNLKFCLFKQRFHWLVLILGVIGIGIGLWLFQQSPVKVVFIGEVNLPKPIIGYRVETRGRQQSLILVIEDGQGWRLVVQNGKLVCEPVRQLKNAIEINAGFFDMDKDGCPEFFRAEIDTLWVFKRRESVKGKFVERHPLPSWFSLDNSQWVVRTKIPLRFSSLTFVTEPNLKQPRKVVVLGWWGKNFPLLKIPFVLNSNGKLIPFNSGVWSGHDYWWGVVSAEDLDHDGTCEVVMEGDSHYRKSPGKIGIYKWNGQTYQLWWTSPGKGEYVVDAKLNDFNGDGIKEIAAVLDVKGQKALTVYRLENGRYRKVAQCWLTKKDYPTLAAVTPMSQGSIIAIQLSYKLFFYRYCQNELLPIGQLRGTTPVVFSRTGTDLFVSDYVTRDLLLLMFKRLPSSISVWLRNTFGDTVRPATKVFSWDGKGFHFRSRFWGATGYECIGETPKGNWVLLREGNVFSSYQSPFYYRLLFGKNGRYRLIWEVNLPRMFYCAVDLDGDGADELVFVNFEEGRAEVFGIAFME